HPAYDQSQQAYRPGTGAPPTTMQEQANALSRSGSSPAASAPIEEQSQLASSLDPSFPQSQSAPPEFMRVGTVVCQFRILTGQRPM
ncbi:hypothetical protein ACC684_38945, partial [Rhizobium ruizarguesonis]